MTTPKFRPWKIVAHPHLQTCLGTLGRRSIRGGERIRVPVSGGDTVIVTRHTPEGWEPGSATVLLVHGLCGSEESRYVVRMTRALTARGVRVVRMNQRGCGPGQGEAKGIPHAGREEDVARVIAAACDDEPTHLIGYSLGGNLVVRAATTARAPVASVAAVGAPLDLEASSVRIGSPGNRWYQARFVRQLAEHVHRHRGDILNPSWSLRQVDDKYTALQSGFRDADDYYQRASGLRWVRGLDVPALLLFADDDPFVPVPDVPQSDHTVVETTSHGGHLGFLAAPWSEGGMHWLETRLLLHLAGVGVGGDDRGTEA